MLEGNFRDVSLPGLLQFLANEINKSYRIRVTSENHNGEIFVCKGFITASAYGLLEGEDALCEFLSWKDGSFGVELLNSQIEIKRNLQIQVRPTANFADQSAFLSEQNVGLNSVLIVSKNFGSPEWQETIKNQPLERDDFMVLGWFGPGRTMRQASREFNFDVVRSTEILFRLVATKSILVIRAGSVGGTEPGAETVESVSSATVQRFLTTGGQEAAAARVAHEAARALAQEANNAMAQDAFISTSFKTDAVPRNVPQQPIPNPRVDMAQVRASMEARLRAKSGRSTYSGPGLTPEQVHDLTAQTTTGQNPAFPDPRKVAINNSPSAVTLPPVPLKELLAAQAESPQALEQAVAALNDYSDYNNRTQPTAASNAATNSSVNAAPNSVSSGSAPFRPDASTPKTSHTLGAALNVANAQLAAQQKLNQNIQNPVSQNLIAGKNQVVPGTVPLQTADSNREAPLLNPAAGLNRTAASNSPLQNPALQNPALQNPVLQNPALQNSAIQNPAIQNPAIQNPALQNPTSIGLPAGSGSAAANTSHLDSLRHADELPLVAHPVEVAPKDVPQLATNNAFAKLVEDEIELAAREEATRLKTASLPLVSMDIERLLLATFKQTQFGKLALTNPSLDQLRRQTLIDVEAGKTLTQVLSEGNRPPAAVLSSYRYCLDRGFIESSDAVVSLTADLLLGRVELDQYLLQRRRITGDELRELGAQARRQNEALQTLFLRNGYVTQEDLETLTREQKRFAFK